MDRIKQKDLEYLVDRINEVTGNAKMPYNRENGQITANIGNYHLDYAYGGVKLIQMVNEHGGISDISRQGYGTKRELYIWMQAFLVCLAKSN